MRFVCLFQILSIVQQTRVKWALSVRKTASWGNLLHQKFRNSILYCWSLWRKSIPKNSQRLGVNLKTVLGIQNDLDGLYVGWVIRQLKSLTLIVLLRKELLYFLIRSRPWLTTIPASQYPSQKYGNACVSC